MRGASVDALASLMDVFDEIRIEVMDGADADTDDDVAAEVSVWSGGTRVGSVVFPSVSAAASIVARIARDGGS